MDNLKQLMDAFHPSEGTVPRNSALEIYFIYEYRFQGKRVLTSVYRGSSFNSPDIHLTLEGPNPTPYTLVLPLSKVAHFRVLNKPQ